MYASHFGLKREPFSIAPDPRYLFMSERHREALAHLLYGVGGGGGFVLLTGEIGAGKTTVCRAFLEQIPRRCNVAYIFNPKLSVLEMLQSVCDEFGIPQPLAPAGHAEASVKAYVDALNEYLLRTHAVGQNNVLIIDEAQNLSADVLEQLRLLTNLETNERKLLQIMLIGQPELREMLARPELEQLAQRVIARFHLDALGEMETAHYIQHRLAVAGRTQVNPFDRRALRRVHQLTRGVPRRINLLCDRALLGAYAGGLERITRDQVDQAAREVFDEREIAAAQAASQARAEAARVRRWPKWGWRGWGALGLVTVAGAVAIGLWRMTGPPVSRMSATLSLPASAASVPSGAVTARPRTPLPPLLDGQALLQRATVSEKAAWQALAPAWQLELGEGEPCLAAQRQQVQCFKGSGGLPLIRQLDRPAILMLNDAQGQTRHVLLTGLRGDMALVQLGADHHALPMAALARVWRGDVATFWRTPPGFRSKLQVGQKGATVDWLAERLARVDGGPGPSPSQTLDAALQARVHAFQLTQGLKPDGVVGATTFMLLNRASGVQEPRLTLEER